jgi:hypothetical protein
MLLALHHGYRVVAHDRRGHGRSTQVSEGNDMNHYADDLAELIAERVGPPDNAYRSVRSHRKPTDGIAFWNPRFQDNTHSHSRDPVESVRSVARILWRRSWIWKRR